MLCFLVVWHSMKSSRTKFLNLPLLAIPCYATPGHDGTRQAFNFLRLSYGMAFNLLACNWVNCYLWFIKNIVLALQCLWYPFLDTLKNLSAWNRAIFSVILVFNCFLTQSKRFYFIVLVLNLKVLYIELLINVFMTYKHFKTFTCPVMAINTLGILKVV